MRRDEVLHHRQSLAEVRGNQRNSIISPDGLPSNHEVRRAVYLRLVTTRSRVYHEVERIEFTRANIKDQLEQLFRQSVCHFCPNANDLRMALPFGDNPFFTVLFFHERFCSLYASSKTRFFCSGDFDIASTHRNRCFCRFREPEILHLIEELNSGF